MSTATKPTPTKHAKQSSAPAKTKVWIITETTYEYDDNYYHFTEGGENSGIPRHVFFSQDKAEKLCRELNTKARADHDIESFEYYENWDDAPDFYHVVGLEMFDTPPDNTPSSLDNPPTT